MKKNTTKLEWTVVASAPLSDEVVDAFGIRDFLYVSPTSEKYSRTIQLSFAKNEDGKQIMGVNIMGHTKTKTFVDQTLKHLNSDAKKRLWKLAAEQDTGILGMGAYEGLPHDVLATIISSLLA